MNDPTPGATGDPRAVRSILPLALRLARQWWPQLAALAAAGGVVAATVTGALGVGDALERGLKSLALARLGRIDVAVLSDDFFRAALAVELGLSMGPDDAGFPSARLVPALVIEAAVESAATADGQRRGGRATVLACDDPAALGFALPPELLEPDAVAVNAVLAESLGLRVGDPLVLRFADRSSVPADSPLGRRTGGSSGKRLRVGQVLPGTPQAIDARRRRSPSRSWWPRSRRFRESCVRGTSPTRSSRSPIGRQQMRRLSRACPRGFGSDCDPRSRITDSRWRQPQAGRRGRHRCG